ncbi:MAG: hypothetical protein AAGA30_00840, partial [Planctomycetota bacterium]
MLLEILLIFLVLAISGIVVGAHIQCGRLVIGCGLALPAFILVYFILAAESNPLTITSSNQVSVDESEIENRPIEVNVDGYVSSDRCRACHPHHYDSWHSSHHRTMTQVPTKDSVIANFDSQVLRREGREFEFFTEDDKYFMEMRIPKSNSKKNGAAPSRTFELVLSTGAHHKQAFWCETQSG